MKRFLRELAVKLKFLMRVKEKSMILMLYKHFLMVGHKLRILMHLEILIMVIQFEARFLLGVPDLNVHVPNDDYQEEVPTSSSQLLEIARFLLIK